jgi:hypothetical protein
MVDEIKKITFFWKKYQFFEKSNDKKWLSDVATLTRHNQLIRIRHTGLLIPIGRECAGSYAIGTNHSIPLKATQAATANVAPCTALRCNQP